MNLPTRKTKLNRNAGVGIVELLIVVAIVGVVSAIALASFQRSNRNLKLSGATRALSTYLEKARVDSIRRHGGARIDLNSATSYTLNIDFGGNGSPTALTVNLPPDTSLTYSLPPATASINPSTTPTSLTYDWRGRVGTQVLITLTNASTGLSSTAMVGSVGDISTDTTIVGPVIAPTPQTTVATSSGIKSMR